MITKIKSEYTLNVTEENEVFNISKELISNKLDIAAIYWEVQSIERTKIWKLILEYISKLIAAKISSLKLWYIFGTGSWIVDNRVTRYKGFIKDIKNKYNISNLVKFIEIILESKTDKEIKFFSAVQLSELEDEIVIKLIEEMLYTSYIIAAPVEYEINNLISLGWDTSANFDINLLLNVIRKDGLIIKPFGYFDDRETGYTCLGSPEKISTLICK